jgi:hypothetical protein
VGAGGTFFGPGGSLTYGGINALTISLSNTSGNQGDQIVATPSPTTSYVFHGGAPGAGAVPGDRLELALPPGVKPALTAIGSAGPGSGVWTFPGSGLQAITFTDVESLSNITSIAVASKLTAGGPWMLRVFDAKSGVERFAPVEIAPARYRGTIRMAVADVTGDSIPDVIVALGRGTQPLVSIYNGATGQLVRQFLAYPRGYHGGLHVAAADVLGDGRVEIIVTADARQRRPVQVFDTAGNLLRTYRVPRSKAGFSVAAGDVNGDGKAEIILGELAGRKVHVLGGDGRLLRTIAAFRSAGGGIAVAAGDVNGDGRAEVIAGATAATESPAANLTSSVVFRKPIPVQAFDAGTGALRQQLLPTGLPARGPAGGLPFASVKPDENGVADLLLGATSGTSPVVRVEDWLTGAELLRLLASPLPTTPGVFVAGS